MRSTRPAEAVAELGTLADFMNVELRIGGVSAAAETTRKRLPFATIEGDDIVLQSALPAEASLNEHLVWLWGLLQHERRYLKGLAGRGASIIVRVRGVRQRVEVKPNGAEMLHLLGATLVIDR